MDSQTILNWMFSGLGGLAVFVLYGLRDDLKAQKDANAKLLDRIGELHAHIVRDYVRRDDYRDDVTEIKGMLVRIFDLIERKADKP